MVFGNKIPSQKRWQKYYSVPLLERLMKYVQVVESGCHVWTGHLNTQGYGSVTIHSKTHLAHRVIWKEKVGTIPQGMWLLHKCDNPKCVNIDHIFLGTPKDNTRDSINKGRFIPIGLRIRGENHPFTNLKVCDVKNIRRKCSEGKKQYEVARDYGIDPSAISRIVNKQNWSHVR